MKRLLMIALLGAAGGVGALVAAPRDEASLPVEVSLHVANRGAYVVAKIEALSGSPGRRIPLRISARTEPGAELAGPASDRIEAVVDEPSYWVAPVRLADPARTAVHVWAEPETGPSYTASASVHLVRRDGEVFASRTSVFEAERARLLSWRKRGRLTEEEYRQELRLLEAPNEEDATRPLDAAAEPPTPPPGPH